MGEDTRSRAAEPGPRARKHGSARVWLRLLITLLALAAAAGGIWCYLGRARLARQWAAYRVGKARTHDEAQARIAWFESGPDPQARLHELVEKWDTGNEQFDLYLAQYVASPESSEALRKEFSLQFAWHEERLPRWAHYWNWQAPQQPDQEIAAILAYLDLMVQAEPSKTITWRELLDLQAVFCLAGEPHLARRLDPENWRDRYRRWRKENQDELPHVARPGKAFPDHGGENSPRKVESSLSAPR